MFLIDQSFEKKNYWYSFFFFNFFHVLCPLLIFSICQVLGREYICFFLLALVEFLLFAGISKYGFLLLKMVLLSAFYLQGSESLWNTSLSHTHPYTVLYPCLTLA